MSTEPTPTLEACIKLVHGPHAEPHQVLSGLDLAQLRSWLKYLASSSETGETPSGTTTSAGKWFANMAATVITTSFTCPDCGNGVFRQASSGKCYCFNGHEFVETGETPSAETISAAARVAGLTIPPAYVQFVLNIALRPPQSSPTSEPCKHPANHCVPHWRNDGTLLCCDCYTLFNGDHGGRA